MKCGPSPVTRQRLGVCLEIFKRAAASSTVNRTSVDMVRFIQRRATDKISRDTSMKGPLIHNQQIHSAMR